MLKCLLILTSAAAFNFFPLLYSSSIINDCIFLLGDLTNLVSILKTYFKLPSSSVPRHIRKTFRSINHSVPTSLSHPHCRWIAPKTNGWSKQQGNFHLETRGVRWPPLVSLLVCLLTHKWSPKSNPLVITVRGTVGSHRGSDGVPKSIWEKERWYRKWKDIEKRGIGNWCVDEREERRHLKIGAENYNQQKDIRHGNYNHD